MLAEYKLLTSSSVQLNGVPSANEKTNLLQHIHIITELCNTQQMHNCIYPGMAPREKMAWQRMCY